jgi:hypothetical protein
MKSVKIYLFSGEKQGFQGICRENFAPMGLLERIIPILTAENKVSKKFHWRAEGAIDDMICFDILVFHKRMG